MEPTKTERGFDIIYFTDHYSNKCSLQKSSLADQDCIWLGVDDLNPLVMASEAAELGIQTDQTRGWVSYPIPSNVIFNNRMHLTRAQAAELLPYLQKFVDTGELT